MALAAIHFTFRLIVARTKNSEQGKATLKFEEDAFI